MPGYYDDNFGWYEIEDQEDLDFYMANQLSSVNTKCKGCGRTVRLLPEYIYCNSCTQIVERGGELPEFD
jgi:hypothetical protein